MLPLAQNITVTLTMDAAENSLENTEETGLFNRAEQTRRTLVTLAQELDIPVKTLPFGESKRFKSKDLICIEKDLFRLKYEKSETDGGVTIIEAANKRLETAAAAAEIIRLTATGARYKDIGIITRDETYFAPLKQALFDAGIPFFADDKRRGAAHPLAELIKGVFAALRRWRHEDILRVLRTGFLPAVTEQIDILENYAREFGINGKRHWLAEESWRWLRTEEYSVLKAVNDEKKENTDTDLIERAANIERKLTTIDLLRRTATAPLANFADKLQKSKTLREITLALYEFLMELDVPSRLEEWATAAEKDNRPDKAAEHRQIWNGITEIMDQLVQTGGDDTIKPADYADLLAVGLNALQVSLIPPGRDYVTIADFDRNSLDNIPILFIVGANDTVMPRRIREKGILTDADRLRLDKLGVKLPSGTKDTAMSENYLLYKGFTKAREKLFVSYALANTGGEGLTAAAAVKKLQTILPNVNVIRLPLSNNMGDGEEMTATDILRLAERHIALNYLAAVLSEYKAGGKMSPWWRDVYNFFITLLRNEKEQNITKITTDNNNKNLARNFDMIIHGLFAKADMERLDKDESLRLFTQKGRLRGSVTRFERFSGCPFAHFARYGLRLTERKEYEFAPFDIGIMLHDALREFGETLAQRGKKPADLTEDEAVALMDEIIDRAAPLQRSALLLSNALYRHRLSHIKLLAQRSIKRLVALDKISMFHPAYYERRFKNLRYTLKDGTVLEITGQIDRLDISEDGKYFLVYDYKTGSVSINLTKIYYALQLQLLTYLLAAQNFLRGQKEALPAGILYFFLRYPSVTAKDAQEAEKLRDAKIKMQGYVLDDPNIVKSIDPVGRYLGILVTQKDKINATYKKRLKTAEEFNLLCRHTEMAVKEIGDEIMAGVIKAAPGRLDDEAPCKYCEYRAVCKFDPMIDGYTYRELPSLDEEEIIEKITDGKGSHNGMDEGTERGY